MKTIAINTSVMLIFIGCVVLAISVVDAEETSPSVDASAMKEYRMERGMTEDAQKCIECHAKESPGIVADWSRSRHAHANVHCMDCHTASPGDKDISTAHFKHTPVKTSAIVSPKDCSRCHPTEAAQYAKSKHANTLDIVWKFDPWFNYGMNNEIERATGCYHCHGSVVEVVDGKFAENTWPNVGVGRLNPDMSKGSCSSCHTRHVFSIAEARKPEACGQCHLGPDHPQIEIYNESKHGAIYGAEGQSWNWARSVGMWAPGLDYRAPTCSVCHMSGVRSVPTTHDVTERLAWETQAPLTVRPSDFKPFPAQTDWKVEREKMIKVCLACHSIDWAKAHFDKFDAAVANYNDVYYKPMKSIVDELYSKKLLSKAKPLDEKLEYDMYELWHHEGRRARFGAAMMAPDYAWWHGFYELKKRCMEIDQQADELLESGKPARIFKIKGATGSTQKPKQLSE